MIYGWPTGREVLPLEDAVQRRRFGRRRHAEGRGQGLLAALVDADRLRPAVERLVAEHEVAVAVFGEGIGVDSLLEDGDGRLDVAAVEQALRALDDVPDEAHAQALAHGDRPAEV